MKVRIGNDIKLSVLFTYKDGAWYIGDKFPIRLGATGENNTQNVNIKSIKAFLINTTKRKEIYDDLKKKTRFVSRFPIEPYFEAYSSTPYDIKSCGRPGWRAFPHNMKHRSYPGFGVYPAWDRFESAKTLRLTEYQAPATAAEEANKIYVFFPAEAQLFTGTYSLVITAKIYQPGYNANNLRTITVDCGEVLTLVDNSEDGVDGDITIDVAASNDSDRGATVVPDIYVMSGKYDDNNLTLNLTNDRDVMVDFSELGWYEGD